MYSTLLYDIQSLMKFKSVKKKNSELFFIYFILLILKKLIE